MVTGAAVTMSSLVIVYVEVVIGAVPQLKILAIVAPGAEVIVKSTVSFGSTKKSVLIENGIGNRLAADVPS